MLGPFASPYDLFTPVTDPDERRKLWLQVGFVLGVAVLPDLVRALWSLFSGPESYDDVGYDPVWLALSLISRAVGVVIPILCVMSLVGQPKSSIGLWRLKIGDFAGAILLIALSFSVFYAAVYPIEELFGSMRGGYGAPRSPHNWFLYTFGEAANAMGEELPIWGFLYVRLRQLWHKHEAPAILAAACAFACYHLYLGVAGFMLVFIDGALRGVFFRLHPRLWPMVLSHALHNVLITLIWYRG